MSKRIIFENQDKSIGIHVPTEEGIERFGLDGIAKKDTELGLPYWIVDTDVIPTDRTFRGAWEVDSSLGEPNGYGEKVINND